MRVLYETSDGAQYDDINEARKHEMSVFERWSQEQHFTPEELMDVAQDLGEERHEYWGTPAEILTAIFLRIFNG